jgi:hypothetical protein
MLLRANAPRSAKCIIPILILMEMIIRIDVEGTIESTRRDVGLVEMARL